jgi:hypothetical protein
MNDLNRTDPDNSARHIYSAAIDVFNRTVIMTCTTLFNRSTRLASQSTFACSLSFFPLAASCWRTTRLLQHTHTQRLASDHIVEQTTGKADTKIENVFDLKHICFYIVPLLNTEKVLTKIRMFIERFP